ncbi:MAG: ACP S-malonyltransferase [Bacilli bacterium]
MTKTAFLFAGQGSQYAGMGRDIYDKYPYVRELYDEASAVLGYDLREICFTENDLLHQTRYTQPAVMTTSYSLYRVFVRETGVSPVVLAGFSLGEYTALCAAGVFSFSDAVRLVARRAIAMDRAAAKNKGAMAAIIAYPRDKLERLCGKIGGVLIANYNCPGQLVVSGETDAVSALCAEAKADGAKRVIPLNVSGAFHSPLMTEAAVEMREYLEGFSFREPSADVILNYNASPLKLSDLKEALREQIVSSVYFEDSVRKIIKDYDVNQFIEFGPGKVLRGFVSRIDGGVSVVSIDKLTDFESLR